MPRYRYKRTSIDSDILQRRITDALIIDSRGPEVLIDITVNASSKEDLDEAMLERGYIYESTNPSDTTDEAIAHTLISPSLDGYAAKQTVDEHYSQHSQAIQNVLVALDGYDGDVSNLSQTVNEHYNQHSEAIQTILGELDGYHSDQTGQEHYLQLSQAIQDIISVLDGYEEDTDISGLIQTETEHYNQHSDAIQTILADMDGYAVLVVEDQRWVDSSQQRQDIRDALDGYATNNNLSGLDQTVTEHYNQHSEALQTILGELDGYHPDITGTEHYNQLSQAIQDIISALDGYEEGSDINGIIQTAQEHYSQHSEALQTILGDLDGYALLSVEDQRWEDSSQQRQDIRDALDGYSSSGSSTIPHIFSFFSTNYEYKSTTNTTYTVMAKFIFPGTSVVGTPSAIKAVYATSLSSGAAYIKIHDDDSNLDICSDSTTDTGNQMIHDLGTLSNLPTNEATWEVHLKATPYKTAYLRSIIIYY